MLKMERGAAGAASRNARVVEMDELKRARDRRSVSPRQEEEPDVEYNTDFRRQYEQWRETQQPSQEDLPFWERDDPFGAGKKTQKCEARQPAPVREARTAPVREPRTGPARETRAAQTLEQRPAPSPAPGPCYEIEYHPPVRASRSRADSRAAQPEESTEHREPVRRRAEYGETREFRTRQPHAEERTEPKKNRKGLRLLMLMLVLLSLAVIIGFKVFQITSILVAGNDTMSTDNIIALSGISVGENIFKANLTQAKTNLESDPMIEVTSITRVFPNKISIIVKLRKPHGAISYLGSYVVIDENGNVLDVRPNLPAGQYPLITGIDIKPTEKGKPVQGVDQATLQSFSKLLAALYDNGAMKYISEINMSDANKVKLYTGEGLEIDIGDTAGAVQKAQWIARTVPKLKDNGQTTGILYVTGTGNPVLSPNGGATGAKNSGTDPNKAGSQGDAPDGSA